MNEYSKHPVHPNSSRVPVHTVKKRNHAHLLDKSAVRRAFNRAAPRYDQSALLQKTVGDRLFDRVSFMAIQPLCVLDLGAGTGQGARHMHNHFPQARVIALDSAECMLHQAKKQLETAHYVCADFEQLPLADASVDCVYANLALQWTQNPATAFQQVYRVLKPGGLFVFSTLGPDTLKELKASWAAVSNGIHTHDFLDMHHVGDALRAGRFQDAVVDREYLTVYHKTVRTVLQDLKDIGAHNATIGRSKGLMGKHQFQSFIHAYEQLRHANGLLPVTYEVVYGAGFK